MQETVEFSSGGTRVEALLFTPDNGTGPHPIVVMAGGWCYVKELVQPIHAQAFCDAGVAALVFDYRTFGGSDGEPRLHIDPQAQIEDYRNAISFVRTMERFDPHRIGVWGISYSGGHVLILGAVDRRVRCVVSLVPVIDGWQNLRLAHGTVGFRRLLAAVDEDRERRFETGEHTYLPHQPDAETDLATWPFPHSKPVFRQLRESQAPAYEGEATTESTEMLLDYSVAPFLPRLFTPTLMMLAEGDDHTHWDLALDAYATVPAPSKRLEVLSKSSHLSFYEDQQRVDDAAGTGRDWLVAHLVGDQL